jgi:hypothetical protein
MQGALSFFQRRPQPQPALFSRPSSRADDFDFLTGDDCRPTAAIDVTV